VKPAVPLAAQPFPLRDVKLLDGPLRHAQSLDAAYLLTLEPDRLLARFREFAGLKPKAKHYGGWEAESLSGHTLGHYLSACSLMFEATGDARFRQRVEYIVGELDACQRAHGDGYLAGFPDGRKAFAEVAAGEIRAKSFNLNGVWSPFYTLHKLFAGLGDAHRLCGSRGALEIQIRLAGWVERTLAKFSDAQMQDVLQCEFGGMNESLADLYADTGDRRWLALSHRFDHRAVYDPLLRGEDCLCGLHANTQVPKFAGLARRYELAGGLSDRRLAEFFWDRVVRFHSYVTGGNSESEYFGPPGKLHARLSTRTTETCNTYNMLKLTRQLWMLEPRAALADYYERGLWNHILASQNPRDGMVTYFVPLRGGFFKEYTTPQETFTCCLGTGMENHAKYGDSIYFHVGDVLWVNQFIASELTWRQWGVTLRQETQFPKEDTIALSVKCAQSVEFALRLRHPAWAAGKLEVSLNGRPHAAESQPGGYWELRRMWRDGDRLQVRFPMPLRLEAMPDNPRRVAVFHGPVLLAGDLGPIDDPAARDAGFVPVMVPGDRNLGQWIEPAAGDNRAFRTKDAGRPRDVTLVPFYRLHQRRYAVYWDLCTQAEWQARQTAARDEARRQRKLDAATIDHVRIGDAESERAHNLRGEAMESEDYNGRAYRLSRGKWFSYELSVPPEGLAALVCTYWGGERPGSRFFDIAVDGQPLAKVELADDRPEQFFDAVYILPAELTRGKQKVTVTFTAQGDKWAGGVFDLRIVRPQPESPESPRKLSP